MNKSITTKGLAVAGFWFFSIFATDCLIASELTIPASLLDDKALTAPLYIPVTPQQIKVPVVSNWTDVNQRVHDIGGWMFYASEGAMDHEQHKQPQQPEPKTHQHEGH
ncbi:hypothetical protein [Arsukibacterium sp.]|uniref:hypothetical protein n=1 Tax=Arsukibacterium sp. TaxID=1977258 RepID=UPI003563DFBE